MKGRRPAPLETKIAKGSRDAKSMVASAPGRVSALPEAPAWLAGHALTCWTRTSGLLLQRGQLSADAEMSLTALCQCYAEWVELAEDIRVNGRFQTIKTKAGASSDDDDEASYMERVRPAVAAFQDCDRRLKGWLIEFGLTDASRGKVAAAGEDSGDDDDPLARYGLN